MAGGTPKGMVESSGGRCSEDLDGIPWARDLAVEDVPKLRSLHAAFRRIDADGSGQLAEEELAHALEDATGRRPPPELVSRLIAVVDRDKTGEVSLQEFWAAFRSMEGLPSGGGAGGTADAGAVAKAVARRWLDLAGTGDVGNEFSAPLPPMQGSDAGGSAVPPWQFFLAGGAGGVCSRTLTAPLDKAKILAQTGTDAGGPLHALRAAVRQQGWRSSFAGNGACCLRVFPFAGIVCLAYGQLLSLLPADAELDAAEPVWRVAAGAGAGAAATAMTYPLDVARARLAVHDAAQGGPKPGVLGALSQVAAAGGRGLGGLQALFRGLRPTLTAAVPFVAVQQASYDCLKAATVQHGGLEASAALFLGCGAAAGALAQAAVHPVDVVRRRIQCAQVVAGQTPPHWTGLLGKLVRQGPSAMFVGLGRPWPR